MRGLGGVRQVLVCAVVAVTATKESNTFWRQNSVDYTPTYLEDPLQPVWDRLDALPGEVGRVIEAQIEAQMETFLSRVGQTIEDKMEANRNQTQDAIEALNFKLLALEDKFDRSMDTLRLETMENNESKLPDIETSLTQELNRIMESLRFEMSQNFEKNANLEVSLTEMFNKSMDIVRLQMESNYENKLDNLETSLTQKFEGLANSITATLNVTTSIRTDVRDMREAATSSHNVSQQAGCDYDAADQLIDK